MSSPRSSTSSEEHTRKRVCKACDRCRLKKSKCDGASPCSRCKADNAICVFGERKKAHDKIYPKGYVEMLEQQQSQLVTGLRDMYGKLLAGERWPGKPLKESHGGFPLTHDILERLNVLHMSDSSMTHEGFEDDLESLQQRCLKENGVATMRRRAMSEESEPSLTSSSESSHGMSSPAQSISFTESFAQNTPPTPAMDADFYRSLSQKSQQYLSSSSMPQQTQFSNPMPAALLQQAWATQQLPLDQSMDVDMVSYNPTMTSDPLLFSTPNAFQLQESMAMGWPDSFDQLINPNALQMS